MMFTPQSSPEGARQGSFDTEIEGRHGMRFAAPEEPPTPSDESVPTTNAPSAKDGTSPVNSTPHSELHNEHEMLPPSAASSNKDVKSEILDIAAPIVAGIIVGIPTGLIVKAMIDNVWIPVIVAAVVAGLVALVVPSVSKHKPEEPEPKRVTVDEVHPAAPEDEDTTFQPAAPEVEEDTVFQPAAPEDEDTTFQPAEEDTVFRPTSPSEDGDLYRPARLDPAPLDENEPLPVDLDDTHFRPRRSL